MSGNLKSVYDVFAVDDRKEGEDALWLKVGTAFAHKNKEGMRIVLQALPANGRLELRRFNDKNADKEV